MLAGAISNCNRPGAAIPGGPSQGHIALNEWAARDLGAKPGDPITLEYYLWKEEGRLAGESATFTASVCSASANASFAE